MTSGAQPQDSRARRLYSAAPWGNLTGAPICALEHLQALRPFYGDVCLVLPEAGPLEARAAAAGIPVWRSPLEFRGLRRAGILRFVRGIGAVVRSRWAYVRGLRRLLADRPGLLHVHGLAPHLPYALLAGRWAGAKIVVTVHEPIGRGWETRLDLWAVRCLADHVVFLSRAMSAQSPAFLRRKSSVVCNFEAAVAAPAPGAVREPPQVTMPARMGRRKGFDVFLETCRRLQAAGIAFKAVMAGGWNSEEERRQAREFVAAHGLETVVEDRGVLSDMEPLYAQTDVLLLTSRRDPFPRVVMEALGRGIPVVASRVDGIPEMVDDGETGILVEPEDAAGFAAAVKRLLDDADLRRRMGATGRERARQRFSPETYAAAMQAIYGRIGAGT